MASRSSYIMRQQLSMSLEELEMAMDNAGVGATAKQLHAITDVKILAYKNFRIDGILKPIPFAMHIADAPLGRRIWACDNGLVISEPERGRVSIVDESGARNITLLPMFKWPPGIRIGFSTPLDAGHLALINYDFARWVNSVEPRSVHEGPDINHGDLITMLKSFHETTSSRNRSSEPLSTAISKISYTKPSPHEHHPGTGAAVEGGGASSETPTVDTGGIKVRCDSMAAEDLPTSHGDLQDQSRSTTTAEHTMESGDSQIAGSNPDEATEALTTSGSTTLQKQYYASVADLTRDIGEDLMQNLPGLSELMFCQVPARFDEFIALRLLFGKIRVNKTGCFHRLWIYFQSPKGLHEQKAPSFKLLAGSAIELPNDELGNDDDTDDDEIDPRGKEKRKIDHGMLEPGIKAGNVYLEAAFHPVYRNYTQLRAFAMYCFMLVGESDPLDDFNPEIPSNPSFTRALLKACELFRNADFGTEESIFETKQPIRQYSQRGATSPALHVSVDRATSITSLGSSYRTVGPNRHPVGFQTDSRLGTGRNETFTASNMVGGGANIRQRAAQVDGLHSPLSKQTTSGAEREHEEILASDVTMSGNEGDKIRSLPALQTVQHAESDSGTSDDMDIDPRSPHSMQKPRPTNNTTRVDHGSPTSNNTNSDLSNPRNEIIPEVTFALGTMKKASRKRTHSSTSPGQRKSIQGLKRVKSGHVSRDVSGQSNI